MSETSDHPVIMCHACGGLNRVPADRELTAAKCGKCGQGLSTPQPVDLTGDRFRRLTQKDTGRFIIDVWAPWCGPCRAMAPSFTASAAQYENSVRHFKFDTEANQAVAATLGLRGVPTLFAYGGGRQIVAAPGARMGPQLDQWIQTTFESSSTSV